VTLLLYVFSIISVSLSHFLGPTSLYIFIGTLFLFFGPYLLTTVCLKKSQLIYTEGVQDVCCVMCLSIYIYEFILEVYIL
jgi:hypothetical protein